MKRHIFGVALGVAMLTLAILPGVSQTPPATKKAPENLPWTRFHPATPPYQPTAAEKQQIQAKTDQLGTAIAELRSRHVDDGLLADVEIYHSAARWKLTYPEEFFRERTVA